MVPEMAIGMSIHPPYGTNLASPNWSTNHPMNGIGLTAIVHIIRSYSWYSYVLLDGTKQTPKPHHVLFTDAFETIIHHPSRRN